MRVFLFGYYGFRNLGDDLMLHGLVQSLERHPRVEGIAILAREDYYRFDSGKVKVYSCAQKGWRGIRSRLGAYLCMLSSQLVVWGGGTCLYESEEAGADGLKRLARNVSLAGLFRVPYVFLGVGIGTVRSQTGRALLQRILKGSAMLFFRDRHSLERALQAAPQARAREGGDLVFLMRDLRKRPAPAGAGVKAIAFCGTFYHSASDQLASCYAASLSRLIARLGAVVHFIPFHGGERSDNLFHEKIARALPAQSVVLHDYAGPADTLALMRQMDFLIGFRLHSVITADLLGIANIAVEYSPKVRYYVTKSGVLDQERLFQLGQEIAPADVERVYRHYRESLPALERFLDQERADSGQSVTTLVQTFIENR